MKNRLRTHICIRAKIVQWENFVVGDNARTGCLGTALRTGQCSLVAALSLSKSQNSPVLELSHPSKLALFNGLGLDVSPQYRGRVSHVAMHISF